jgi:hypothetical protein
MSEEEMKDKGKGDANVDGYALLKLSVQQAIDQQKLRPDLTDADVITQLLWAGVHGVASLHITQPDDRSWCGWLGADKLGQEMIDLIMRGILR